MADSLNKKEIASLVADQMDSTKKEALEYVNAVFNVVFDTLAEGNSVDVAGFGKFTFTERAERKGINPATKETIVIPASKSVKFKASKALLALKDACK